VPLTIGAGTELDLFRFCDTPIFERLHLYRERLGEASA